MSFADRVLTLIEKNKITKNKLLTDIAANHNSFNNWKTQMPGSDVVIKIAQHFNVTTDYLLGLSESPSPPLTDLSEQEADLITAFRNIDNKGRDSISNIINSLAENKQAAKQPKKLNSKIS